MCNRNKISYAPLFGIHEKYAAVDQRRMYGFARGGGGCGEEAQIQAKIILFEERENRKSSFPLHLGDGWVGGGGGGAGPGPPRP